jgi:hypothetical protein
MGTSQGRKKNIERRVSVEYGTVKALHAMAERMGLMDIVNQAAPKRNTLRVRELVFIIPAMQSQEFYCRSGNSSPAQKGIGGKLTKKGGSRWSRNHRFSAVFSPTVSLSPFGATLQSEGNRKCGNMTVYNEEPRRRERPGF